MNAISMAQSAYAPTTAAIKTARSSEYDVISRITYRLKSAIERDDYNDLVAAMYENRTLWTAFATDVADDKNHLPEELRARIFYLAEFTNQHTRLVLRDSVSAVPLLEVNTAIMRGLKAEGSVN